MTRRLRWPRTEDGFTLIELSMATFLSTIILGAVVLIFTSVGQEARDTGLRAELQTQAREVVTNLAAELRAAIPARPGAAAVESLTDSSLVFYTDRYGYTGPEKISYQRSSCSGGFCILRVRRYAAVATSGPNWTYQTVPFNDSVLLERVAESTVLFSGPEANHSVVASQRPMIWVHSSRSSPRAGSVLHRRRPMPASFFTRKGPVPSGPTSAAVH